MLKHLVVMAGKYKRACLSYFFKAIIVVEQVDMQAVCDPRLKVHALKHTNQIPGEQILPLFRVNNNRLRTHGMSRMPSSI